MATGTNRRRGSRHSDATRPEISRPLTLSEDPQVCRALKHSCDGDHLISFAELPPAWLNKPVPLNMYRSTPLARYPTLLLSIFTLHNEFLNIQTHLLPLLLWGAILRAADPAEGIFIAYVLICLGSSVIWHTMAGCAHRGAMKFCTRVDYVGIGLISACIGTIVYYGYAGNPHLAYPFLAVCLLLALGGSVFSFMALPENRFWRLAFFLALVFCGTVFIAGLAILHGLGATLVFVALQSRHVLWNSYSTARTSRNASLRRAASGSSGWRTLAPARTRSGTCAS
ncbi:hemolysin-III related-domain-containing protein [Mycena epipterygia]|nr:hemolysin-III related-domain-containing protein [Mycena epipterygia]